MSKGGRRRLTTLDDVRRYVAGLINRAESGQIDPGLAGRLGYLCNILKSLIEGSSIEERLRTLEKKLEQKGG